MPSRSIRDLRQRPAPVMGVRPTSPQPIQARPLQSAPARGPAVVGTGGQVAAPVPQIQAQPAPTRATVQQGMAQINAAPIQARTPVPVQQAAVGQAPMRTVQPMIRQPNVR